GGNIEAIRLILAGRADREEFSSIWIVNRLAELVFRDSPIGDKDMCAVTAHGNTVREETDLDLFDYFVAGGIYYSHTVVAIAGNIEKSIIRAKSGTGREGDVRACRAAELRGHGWLVAAGIGGGVRSIGGGGVEKTPGGA